MVGAASSRLRYDRLTAGTGAARAHGMVRLDAAVHHAGNDDDRICMFGAWLDGALLGVASVYRDVQLGPPQGGIYRIADVAVRAHDQGLDATTGLIARCSAYAARHGGRTLWCDAPIEAVSLWRRCGFSVGGPARRPRGGGLQLPMVQRVRPTPLRVL